MQDMKLFGESNLTCHKKEVKLNSGVVMRVSCADEMMGVNLICMGKCDIRKAKVQSFSLGSYSFISELTE